ncbi:putative Zn(II)2Cys6 transcription factor (Eurofung) [Fonsecaea pedrosoi]|nr:putative Zn(II)2Cys6 transcription factor (Eurofung) [Fonsecaea pedrosoi]
MQEAATEHDSSRRRRFRIRSEFGLARQWRSRKNRPCDACRRRKSACVIEDRPPCLFCRGRGLECQSTSQPRTRRHSGSQEPDPDDERLESLEPLAESHASTDGMLEMQISPGNTEDQHLLPSPDSHVGDVDTRSPLSTTHPRPPSSNGVIGLEPKVHTLEDGKNLTAHCMGLAAEQDTHLLASFRSVIINETNRVDGDIIQVYAGNPATGTPPLHFSILRDWFMPYDNRIKEESSREIEFKVGTYGPSLVRLYFKHVHPVYCVVSKVRFLRAYKEDRLSIPASLRGVVYGMGAVYWKQDPILRTLHRPFEQYELFHAAQASLERELDAPNLWKLQACLLMIHEKAAGNGTFETPRTWTLSAQAVACAQMIGLHRDPTHWKIPQWEKSLRKKLWWATSYTTLNLDMDDLRFDEDVPDDLKDMVDVASERFEISTAARFLELVKLTQILHTLLDAAFSDHAYRLAMTDLASQETRLLKIQRELESWHSLMPVCVTMNYNTATSEFRNNAPLHLAYFATQVLLFRALMTPASMAAKNNPLSSLRRFFGAAIEQLRAFIAFMNEITLEVLRAFWGRQQVSGTFRLLEQFHESLQRIGELVDEESVNLIRPVALRIDSFFTQAAQIMRRGVTRDSFSEVTMVETPP